MSIYYHVISLFEVLEIYNIYIKKEGDSVSMLQDLQQIAFFPLSSFSQNMLRFNVLSQPDHNLNLTQLQPELG